MQRKTRTKDQRARFVILCEGAITEPQYLNAFARLPEVRAVATLDIRGMGYDPRRLVEESKRLQNQKNQRTEGTQYWCVFDVEAPTPHYRLREAVQMARDNRIRLAISNPCFELWLLLHYADQRKWVDNEECRGLLRTHVTSQRKGIDGNAYMPLFPQALTRAMVLERLHERADRELPNNNPSSGMNHLLKAINPSLRSGPNL